MEFFIQSISDSVRMMHTVAALFGDKGPRNNGALCDGGL